jgi:ABC-type multidrug transport system ATPase subunit
VPSPPDARETIRLEARDICVARGGKSIVDGASLALRAREIITIEGASGSGKTTFLRVLATLTEPDSGRVLLDGADAHAIAPREYRTRVAFVMQEAPMLEGCVADNVATGPRLRGVAMPEAAIDRVLERVGLAGFAAHRASELSGGERQRVALARALANDPEVLLLDEPTSALDPASAARILALVRALAEGGLAVCAVTHVAEHAAELGGRHLVFAERRLHERSEAP